MTTMARLCRHLSRRCYSRGIFCVYLFSCFLPPLLVKHICGRNRVPLTHKTISGGCLSIDRISVIGHKKMFIAATKTRPNSSIPAHTV